MDTLPDNGEGIYILGITLYDTCILGLELNNTERNFGWKKGDEVRQLDGYVCGSHAIYYGKQSIKMLMNHLKDNVMDEPYDEWIKKFDPWIWYGHVSKSKAFRGLYEQIDLTCSDLSNTSSTGIIDNMNV